MWNMPDIQNPEFNGIHVCPRCGSRSTWKLVNEENQMINVQCEADCQGYTMSYEQLADCPFFTLG